MIKIKITKWILNYLQYISLHYTFNSNRRVNKKKSANVRNARLFHVALIIVNDCVFQVFFFCQKSKYQHTYKISRVLELTESYSVLNPISNIIL